MALPSIQSLSRALPGIDGAGDADPSLRPGGAAKAPATSFADALGRAVEDVDALQTTADASAEQVALGGGNLHETALALEKADIALRVAVKVRNKLVETYQDIMRMPV